MLFLTELSIRIETGNTTANALLNTKATLAQNQGVLLTVDAQLPQQLPVSLDDFVILMGAGVLA